MSDENELTEYEAAERAAIQRRTLRVLMLGQMVGAGALASAIVVGAFVVQDILGQNTPWAGIATATTTTGTAVMSQMMARRMRRLGRRPGLQMGYMLAVVGGLIAAFGAQHDQLAVFLVGLFVFGNGQAANLQARYAATDLALPAERGQAMSRIVFASTFGAVFGPLLVGPAEWLSEHVLGLHRYTGPWLVSSALFAAAAVNIGLQLRPDPLVVAGGIDPDARAERPKLMTALRVINAQPRSRLALAAMMISQGAMVGVMAMTPVHLKLHGHEGVSQYVVSLHIAGMYAFSPLVGRISDTRGRLYTIMIGAVAIIGSCALAALSGDVEQLLFPSLWGLGLGWNFGLIGGSSLLSESVPAEHRVAVQGSADLMMSLCGGLAGFTSGFIRRAVGYHLLATLAMVAAGGLLVAAFAARRREEPAPAEPLPAT
ncbi:MAG: MFS transporter [Acidimicrobiales bacterium]